MPAQKVIEFEKNVEVVLNVINEVLNAGLIADVFEGTLTEAQIKCLLFVIRNQELSSYKKVRISDVADALNISLPAATKAINRLMEKSLVKKARDTEDYRNILIKPTDKGLNYIEKFNEARRERLTALYNKCTEEEFDNMLKGARLFIEKNIEDLNRVQLLRMCSRCGAEHREDCLIKKKLATKN